MTNRRIVTDEELDLLAEGELTADERTDLFRRLDEQPGEWKNCALAILEASALRGSIRECIEDQRIPENSREGTSARYEITETRPSTAKRQVKSDVEIHPRTRNRVMSSALVLLTLTAAVLVGYWMGHSRESGELPVRDASEIADRKSNADEPVESRMQIAAKSTLSWLNVGDEKLLAVLRLEDGRETRLVPIVASQTLADQLRQIPPVALRPEQIQEANQNGWNIMQHPQLIAIDRPEAETKIVAVQMVRYKFAGRDAI